MHYKPDPEEKLKKPVISDESVPEPVARIHTHRLHQHTTQTQLLIRHETPGNNVTPNNTYSY